MTKKTIQNQIIKYIEIIRGNGMNYKKTECERIEMTRYFSVIVDPYLEKWLRDDDDDENSKTQLLFWTRSEDVCFLQAIEGTRFYKWNYNELWGLINSDDGIKVPIILLTYQL